MTSTTVNESEHVPAAEIRKGFLWMARILSYMVYVYLILVEIVLLIGFILLLFGANQTADFTQWAYRNLERVMEPFRGIFAPINLGTTNGDVQAVFDTSVLFAMIIYGILALLISVLISWLSSRMMYIKAREADIERRKYEQELREAMQARAAQQAAAAAGVTAAATQEPPPPYDTYTPPTSPT